MKEKLLKILLILLIALSSIYIIRILKLMGICCMFLSILSPLFFGYIIYWILIPIINKFKINRVITTIIIYLLFIGVISLILFNIIPLVIKECNKLFPIIKYYFNHNKYLIKISESINFKIIITKVYKTFNSCFPNIVVVIMNILYSFIFGFYFLISKSKNNFFNIVPKPLKKSINKDLRNYIKSILLDGLFMFILLSILFGIVGLSSPFVFAFFCAITNIIPYIGPYIGGVPAVLIGLTSSLRLGITVTIIIMAVQSLENNIIQPLIVSKNVRINPIYILIGIIIFSHFFGILGMIISTPIVIVVRDLIIYYKKNKPKWLTLILDKL